MSGGANFFGRDFRNARLKPVRQCRCRDELDQPEALPLDDLPLALADERADLAVAEHPRHQIAARAGHLVDDHHLRPPDAGRRAGERVAVARDVVEVPVEVALEHVDDVVGGLPAAVVPLVDDRALAILLREVGAV